MFLQRALRLAPDWVWINTIGRSAPFMDPSETPHRTVDVDGIAIDAAMEPLIRALWKRGMATAGCCQGDSALYNSSARFMPNWGSPAAASVTFTAGDDSAALLLAIRPHCRPGEVQLISSDLEYFHVLFPPRLLQDKSLVEKIQSNLRGVNPQ